MSDSRNRNNDDIRYIASSIAAASAEMTAFANQVRPLVTSALEAQQRIAQMTAPIKEIQERMATISRTMNSFRSSLAEFSEMHDTAALMASSIGKIAREASKYQPIISELYRRLPSPEDTNEAISNIDFEILGQAADEVISQDDKTEADNGSDDTSDTAESADDFVDAVATKIADKYNLSFQQSDGKARLHISAETVITIIITCIMSLPGFILDTKTLLQNESDKPKVIYQQQVQITNNYYQFMSGASIDELNDANFRIVAQNIVVRIKHDCHSHVVDRLEAGDVVQVIGKYRKWRHIEWTDEDNHLRIGWIQNYKLAKFRIITS